MRPVRLQHAELENESLLRAPVSVLNGVTQKAANALRAIDIHNIFELATSRIFHNAYLITMIDQPGSNLFAHGIMPSEVGNAKLRSMDEPFNWRLQDIEVLDGIGAVNAPPLRTELGVNSIADLGLWPPFHLARQLAGFDGAPGAQRDPGVPEELVPQFNEHATEKAYYTVYSIDPLKAQKLPDLEQALDLNALIKLPLDDKPRTGFVLRYEHSWTPIGLTLGNLLHSVALAPGEATRIAIIDWSRKEGVQTSEDISQLESLSNLMMQTRSVNEITRAVAREAQQGFSNINANSTVSNNAYSSYGLQNAAETLQAGFSGAMTGGAAGVVGGGVAGAGIGAVIGGVAGAAGYGVGSVPGWVVGLAAGGAIGAGAGGLVGATAGGVGAALTVADFGADANSGSDVSVDTVTTTSSSGERDVEAEMLQDIQQRTQQHSSTSRNRRASIVQEVSQSEHEKVSTRVVTNYNHMHALTIQYFEVVQMYAVQTTLVSRKRCLYVPFAPVQEWTAELLNLFRRTLIRGALNADVAYSLSVSAQTVLMHSPMYDRVPAQKKQQWLNQFSHGNPLHNARALLGTHVGSDPLNGWRVPHHYQLSFVFGTFMAGGGGPFGGADSQLPLRRDLVIFLRSGERLVVESAATFTERKLRLSQISHVAYEITNLKPSEWKFEDELTEPRYSYMQMVFQANEHDNWETDHDRTLTFYAAYAYSLDMVQDNKLNIPILQCGHGMSDERILQHLNDNTRHYTSLVLKNRKNPLLPAMLSRYAFQGKPLTNIVDPEPVAISGNNLVFILHEAAEDDKESPAKVGSISDRQIIPIGTGGVFAEAVQGRANSAEIIDLERFWNWQDSPIPILPPEIAPIQAGSRRAAVNLRPGSLDAPLAANMTPGALPEPQGLGAMISAISKDLFRDMSGIQQTAELAKTSLEQAMEGAVETGGQASENLQKGLEFTEKLVGEIIKMNSQYAQQLTETGFKALSGGLGGTSGASGSIGDAGSAPALGSGSGPSISDLGGMLQKAREYAANNEGNGAGYAPAVTGGASTGSGGGHGSSLPEDMLRRFAGLPGNHSLSSTPTTPPTGTMADNITVSNSVIDGELLLADFAINSAELKPGHTEALDAFIELMQTHSVAINAIYGRASQTGVEDNNYELSQQRLAAVGSYLVDRGVSAQTDLIPLGESQPLNVNGPLENKADRSVQILYSVSVATVDSGQEKHDPNATVARSSNWAVRVKSGGGKSKKIKAEAVFVAYDIELKNLDTGETLPASITGLGLSLAASFVNNNREWSDWHEFSTQEPVSNDEWQWAWVRITRASVDLYAISADKMLLYFYKMPVSSEALHVESHFGVVPDGSVGFKLEAAAHGQVFLDKFSQQ